MDIMEGAQQPAVPRREYPWTRSPGKDQDGHQAVDRRGGKALGLSKTGVVFYGLAPRGHPFLVTIAIYVQLGCCKIIASFLIK